MSLAIRLVDERSPLDHLLHQAWCTQWRSSADCLKSKEDIAICYDLYQLLRLWFEHVVTNNLFFWKAWSASMSFWRGKALAAGIIWQRISWTGACRDTAKLIPGRSLWSLFIAWTTPTYVQTIWVSGEKENKKENVSSLIHECFKVVFSVLTVEMVILLGESWKGCFNMARTDSTTAL